MVLVKKIVDFCGIVGHPQVGWAPDSKNVEFTLHKCGNAGVVIGYLSLEKWGIRWKKSEKTEAKAKTE